MRLTERDGDKVWFAHGRPRGFLCPREVCDNAYGCDKVKDRTCPYLRLLDKLAAYEDAEEQGLLVRLPCKVGDKVYLLWPCGKHGKSVSEMVVTHIDIDLMPDIEFACHKEKGTGSYWFFKPKDIGKTVFLTREEAEAALKGEREDV